MKKIYFLILVLVQMGSRNATADSIPNSGFEVWYISQWYDIPGSWETNNSQLLAPTVVKDTYPHSGQLAMRLTNSGGLQPHAYAGFPVTTHHQNIVLYTNPLLIPGDSGVVRIYMFNQNQVVDSGSQAIYTGIVTGYYTVIIPISQNFPTADSCMIEIFGGSIAQSDLVIDDISFDFNLGIENRNNHSLKMYPNPCRNFINIQSPLQGLPESVQAFNSSGAKTELHRVVQKDGQTLYDTSVLASGSWIVTIRKNSMIYSGIILKE